MTQVGQTAKEMVKMVEEIANQVFLEEPEIEISLVTESHGQICHGDLKPSNILLTSQNQRALLTDCSLHRLMTPAGIAEQILNLGALGYRAPEFEDTSKSVPTTKTDVYSFGVILVELLTRRSAGDIVFGEPGVVNLTSWVRLCHQEGRGTDCIDRDIAGGEECSRAMDELLTISLRCILPTNERPNVGQVLADLSSLTL